MTKKEKEHVTLAFLIFAMICLIQPFGLREDWPFSFFGMYRGLVYDRDLVKIDFYLLDATGKKLNLFDHPRDSGIHRKIMEISTGQIIGRNHKILRPGGKLRRDEETKAKLREFAYLLLKERIEDWKSMTSPQLILRFRYWREFHQDPNSTPELDTYLLDEPVRSIDEI